MLRPKYPKADSQAQEQFQQNFSAQVEAAVATREAGDERSVWIMAQDEGCFGRISCEKCCWAPPRMCPHASGRASFVIVFATQPVTEPTRLQERILIITGNQVPLATDNDTAVYFAVVGSALKKSIISNKKMSVISLM